METAQKLASECKAAALRPHRPRTVPSKRKGKRQADTRVALPCRASSRGCVAGPNRLDAEMRGDAAGGGRLAEHAVVVLVLVGIGRGERPDRAVERVALAEIGADRDRIARACVRLRERPAADLAVEL